MKTAVAFVLDESGSMYDTASDTRGAVNKFFQELAQETPDASVSLMKFSANRGPDDFRVVCSAVEPSRVPVMDEQTYTPDGNTPLYDAIGKAIVETERVDAEKYVLIILSDGLENASREWTQQAVRDLVQAKDAAENWTIVYLGANQDGILQASRIGLASGNTMSYVQSGAGITATMRSAARATGQTINSADTSTSTFFADAGQTEADYSGKLWTPEKKDEEDKPEGGK